MGFSRVLALPLREAMKHPEFVQLMERFIPKGYNWLTPLITAEVGLEGYRMFSHWWGERKHEVDTKKGVKALETATKVGKRLDATDKNLAKMDAQFQAMLAKLEETNRLLAEQKTKLGTVEMGKTTAKPGKVTGAAENLVLAV